MILSIAIIAVNGQNPGSDDIADPEISVIFYEDEISTTTEVGIVDQEIYFDGYVICMFPDSAPPLYECHVNLFVDSPDIIASDIPDMIFTKTNNQQPIRIELEIDRVYPAYEEFHIKVNGDWRYERNVNGGEIEEVECVINILPFSRVEIANVPQYFSKDYKVGEWYEFEVKVRNLGNFHDHIILSLETDSDIVEFVLDMNETFLDRNTEAKITGRFRFNKESNEWHSARIVAKGSQIGGFREDGEILLVKKESSSMNEGALMNLIFSLLFLILFLTSMIVGIILIIRRYRKSRNASLPQFDQNVGGGL
jgi:hypothetical protein